MLDKNLIEKGDKVLTVDDLVATDGNLKAAIDLVEKTGGIVVGYLVILSVLELREQAKEKLADVPLIVLM